MEDQSNVAVVESPISEPQAAEIEQAQPAEETRPSWMIALDDAPAEELRKHPKWGGMLGGAIDHERQKWEREFKDKETVKIAAAEQARIAAETEAAEAELDRLAEENPLAFADRIQHSRQIKRAQAHIEKLQGDSRNAVASSIGAEFKKIPEWESIVNDPAMLDRLSSAVQGLPEDQVIPAWNREAINIVSEVRANNRAEERIAARIEQEKAAWTTQALAEGLITSARPTLNRGRGLASNDPEPNWKTEPKEYAAWYKRNT